MEESQSRLNIIILDACRNNPFRGSRGGDRGLAAISAGKGTFLAFATGPNQIASDNTARQTSDNTAGQTSDNTAGQNGLFTNYLLMEMQKPGLKLEEVFRRVVTGVSDESRGAQQPWTTSSWYGDFYFIQPGERTFGTLRVTVNAEGAEISLIGQEKNIHTWSRGADTMNFPDIPAGKYELSISKQGYVSDCVGREVEVLDGQTTTVLVNLVPENPEPVEPALGAIRLSLNTSDPDGILLDGSPTQPIKLSERLYEIRDVPVGDHTIEIIKSGYLPSPFRSIASVSVGETTTARVELRTVRDALKRVAGQTDKVPVAALAAVPTSGKEPLSVAFNASGSRDPDGGTIQQYYFDFGDGGGILQYLFFSPDQWGGSWVTQSNFPARWWESGTYEAKVTVKDDEGTETTSAAVMVTVTEDAPDLYPTGLGANPTTLKSGQTANVRFNMVNGGHYYVRGTIWSGIYLQTSSGSPMGSPFHNTHMTDILPVSQTAVSFDVIIPSTVTPGDYYICVLVDRDNGYAESDETNNFACIAVTIVSQ